MISVFSTFQTTHHKEEREKHMKQQAGNRVDRRPSAVASPYMRPGEFAAGGRGSANKKGGRKYLVSNPRWIQISLTNLSSILIRHER